MRAPCWIPVVLCSGDDSHGKLGNGTGGATDTHGPVDASTGMTGAIAKVASAFHHTCALTATTGEVWCWGWNALGQLGVDTNISERQSPIKVQGLALAATDIGARYANPTGYTRAILTDGSAWCWGNGGHGELGNGVAASSSARSCSRLAGSSPSHDASHPVPGM